MFVKEALSILDNRWLGPYDDITLSKGIFGILFLVSANILGISYLTFSQIFYFLACISVIHMLNNFIKNKKILLIIYLVLLFNPISFSDAFSFVYREGVYTSLILFFIAFSFCIFFNYKSLLKTMVYSFLFGLTYTSIYFCREENVWLVPYILVAGFIIVIFIFKDKECKQKFGKVLSIIGVPVGILIITTIIISSINYKYYGRFITNDYTSKDFTDAYGALTRIKQDNYIERVPLNEETRKKLYELSPKFKELEPYMEGPWVDIYRYIDNDIQDGFLYWALRIAVREAGYYKNAATARDFYIDLADEINDLCDSKKLECLPKRSSLLAPLHKSLIDNLFEYIPKAFATQITYKYVDAHISKKYDDAAIPKLFYQYQTLTNNKLMYSEKDLKSINMKIMEIIAKIYSLLNPVLFVISLLCYIIIMVMFFVKKLYSTQYKQVILLNGLLAIYLMRVGLVGYIAATEYKSAIMKCQYLACSYPVQSLFILLAIVSMFNLFKEYTKKEVIR